MIHNELEADNAKCGELSSLYQPKAYHQQIERLASIVETLRVACPWDREQTFESLLPQSKEELYELQDAVINKDWQNLKEELGDLLLHILFYSKMAQEIEEFAFADVIEGVANKLVSRHPHVYGFANDDINADGVKQQWEAIKKKEGKKSILSGVPVSTPALEKAYIIQNKVKHVGFEFDTLQQVVDKCKEEWSEVEEAIEQGDDEALEEELGDLLFSIVNLIRYKGLEPDRCLEKTNQKFQKRFQFVEKKVDESGHQFQDFDLEALDAFWDEAKKEEK